MGNITNINENYQDAPPPAMVVLEDFYEKAFIGHDVSLTHHPRACYSLPLLSKIERARMKCDEEKAQHSVIAMVKSVTGDHGDEAPVFVDDSITRVKKERSRIVRPGGR